MILATYSPTSPMANRLREPKNSVVTSIEVAPRGAMSGRNSLSTTMIAAASTDSINSTTPTAVSIVNGVSLNEKIKPPFLAQPRFFMRLLVERPNMRSGRT